MIIGERNRLRLVHCMNTKILQTLWDPSVPENLNFELVPFLDLSVGMYLLLGASASLEPKHEAEGA